jgi:transposase-like protein
MAVNYSTEMKTRVKNMMLEGESDTDISKVTGISTNTLRIWRRNFALPPSPGPSSGYSKEVKKEAVELMKQNQTNKDISEMLNISTTTIANWRKAAGITNSTTYKKYSDEIKSEALALMKDGMTNSEVNKILDVHSDTLRGWRKNAGLEPSKGGRKPYSIDQINDVIDWIREGNTISEISKLSGVNHAKIRSIREEEVRNGNHLPEFVKGISRIQKYSDEELIELVYLNPGYGLNRFVQLLGITKNFIFELSMDYKEFTNGEEDLIALLQDESYGQMISRSEYYEITGKTRAPRGMGAGTGGRTSKPDRVETRGRLLKDVYLPPQNFEWGAIQRKIWRNKKRKEIIWIEERVEDKGYISAQEDRDDFILETGAGKTKFNQWMKKAGLFYDKKTGRWINDD